MSDSGPHRLFHTLVVLGAAFGAACGSDRVASDDADSDGAGGTTGGSGNSGGTANASGGAFGGSTPGVWVHYAGAAGSAGSNGFIAPDCTSEQWACDVELDLCATFDNSIRFDDVTCKCEGARPVSEDDCKADERLVCYRASVELPSPYPDEFRFQCSCEAEASACSVSRTKLEGCEEGDTRSVLYGCAYVLLR